MQEMMQALSDPATAAAVGGGIVWLVVRICSAAGRPVSSRWNRKRLGAAVGSLLAGIASQYLAAGSWAGVNWPAVLTTAIGAFAVATTVNTLANNTSSVTK